MTVTDAVRDIPARHRFELDAGGDIARARRLVVVPHRPAVSATIKRRPACADLLGEWSEDSGLCEKRDAHLT